MDMAEIIIWCAVNLGCAVLFYSIGVYAKRLKKPMWFWSGTEVDPAELTDVAQYNKANALMWKLYSMWFFLAALLRFWGFWAAMTVFILGFAVGTPLLVFTYCKIYKKYKAK